MIPTESYVSGSTLCRVIGIFQRLKRTGVIPVVKVNVSVKNRLGELFVLVAMSLNFSVPVWGKRHREYTHGYGCDQ